MCEEPRSPLLLRLLTSRRSKVELRARVPGSGEMPVERAGPGCQPAVESGVGLGEEQSQRSSSGRGSGGEGPERRREVGGGRGARGPEGAQQGGKEGAVVSM